MPKILVTIAISLLWANACLAQEIESTNNHKYRGAILKVGRVNAGTSLMSLNSSLESLQLRGFNQQFFSIGVGYSWVTKQGIYFGIASETATQLVGPKAYNQTFTSSAILLNGGFEVFNKKNIIITPIIGVGLNTLSLLVSETPLPSSTNFNSALFLTRESNSIVNPQATLQGSIAAVYKIKVGDKEELIEGGRVIAQRQLPIGLEIGYRYGRSINGWSQTDNLDNAPVTDFSGYFFSLRFGSMYKRKTFQTN